MTHISLTLSDTDGKVSYALDDLLSTIKERAHEHRCYRR